MLSDRNESKRFQEGRDLYMGKIFDMEKLVAQGEDKHKESLKINSELADKI
jgi:hypothetical protein